MAKLDAARIAALEAEADSDDEETKSAADDKLGRIKAILDEEDEEKDDEEAAADGDDAPEAGKSGGSAKIVAPKGVDATMAVLNLASAKGREDQAKILAGRAGKGEITVEMADELLAASPKASRLGDRMAGRDQGLTPGGGATKPGEGLASAVDRMNEAQKRRA